MWRPRSARDAGTASQSVQSPPSRWWRRIPRSRPLPEEFHISSLVVHCHRTNADQVATTLRAMNGMEVRGGIPEGKLVVTLETATEGEIVECLNQVQLLEGVLAATL